MRDIDESMRTQAHLHRHRKNPIQATKLENLAEYIENLREEITVLKTAAVRLFNSGYAKGHNDSVESCFTDIHESEMEIIHEEIVNEILLDSKKDRQNAPN